jgi:hypothetical protein
MRRTLTSQTRAVHIIHGADRFDLFGGNSSSLDPFRSLPTTARRASFRFGPASLHIG